VKNQIEIQDRRLATFHRSRFIGPWPRPKPGPAVGLYAVELLSNALRLPAVTPTLQLRGPYLKTRPHLLALPGLLG
jgi:hypothetical protein